MILTKPCIISNQDLSNGYPRETINGVRVQLNRYILEQKLGRPISPKHLACHKCGVRNCIEPEHIYEGTYEDNNHDTYNHGNWSGWGSKTQSLKTHCAQGHEYNEKNTYYHGYNRHRLCRICDKLRKRAK